MDSELVDDLKRWVSDITDTEELAVIVGEDTIEGNMDKLLLFSIRERVDIFKTKVEIASLPYLHTKIRDSKGDLINIDGGDSIKIEWENIVILIGSLSKPLRDLIEELSQLLINIEILPYLIISSSNHTTDYSEIVFVNEIGHSVVYMKIYF